MTEKTGAEKIRWNLTDLYQSLSDPKLDQDLKKTQTKANQFQKKYKGKVGKLKEAEIKKAYQTIEELLLTSYKISHSLPSCI